MTTWMERVDTAVRDAYSSADTATASALRRPLTERLQHCVALIDTLPVTGPEPLVAALRAAMAIMLVADEQPDEHLAERIGAALNACLDRPGRTSVLESQGAAAFEPNDELIASFDRPMVHRAVRAPFCAGRSTPPIDATNDEAAHDADELDPEVPDEADEPTTTTSTSTSTSTSNSTTSVEPKPAVRLVEPSPPMAIADIHRDIVHLCADNLGMLSRHREEGALEEVSEVEARILLRTDAIAALGGACVQDLMAWWAEAQESPDPHKTWAAIFALSTMEGTDTLQAIAEGLSRIGERPLLHVRAAADALAVAPHPGISLLARDLLERAEPIARAVGVECAGRLGALDLDQLITQLLDTNVEVATAALRVCARGAPPSAEIVPLVRKRMHDPNGEVAWEACRTLSLWGSADGYRALKSDDRLARVLGVRGAELLVMFGDADDLGLLQRIVGPSPGEAAISAVARFGHPASWAYLLHFLDDDDLSDDAASGLTTLFGERVTGKLRKEPSAWRDAIARGRFDPEQRHRCGEPWHPAVVARECRSGRLSKVHLAPRIDELMVRTATTKALDLSAWWPQLDASLSGLLAPFASMSVGWRAGEFACLTRG